MPIQIEIEPSKILAVLGIVGVLSAGVGGYFVLKADVDNLNSIVSTEGVRAFAELQTTVKAQAATIKELKDMDKVLHQRITRDCKD